MATRIAGAPLARARVELFGERFSEPVIGTEVGRDQGFNMARRLGHSREEQM
jgi:hypothetical protein